MKYDDFTVTDARIITFFLPFSWLNRFFTLSLSPDILGNMDCHFSHLSMSASMDDIGALEPFIAHVSQQTGLEDRESKRLRLAVEEAVANVINHGQATTITLQASVEDSSAFLPPFGSKRPEVERPLGSSESQLVLTIDDDGLPFDPTADSPTDFSVPADQRPPGGLGIKFLHEMTDGLTYQRVEDHNILTIIKLINKNN